MEHVDIRFTTSADIQRVWPYFTEVDHLSKWHGHAEVFEAWLGGRVRFKDDGWKPVEGTIAEIERHRLIRWVVPADGSEIIETFTCESEEVRVHVLQRGLHPEWPTDGIAGRIRGWEESIADLLLILDHHVSAARHMIPRARLGASTLDTMAGLLVTETEAGGPADVAGLRAGDLVLMIGRAPIYRKSDLGVILRSHRKGDVATIRYVRDQQLHEMDIELG